MRSPSRLALLTTCVLLAVPLFAAPATASELVTACDHDTTDAEPAPVLEVADPTGWSIGESVPLTNNVGTQRPTDGDTMGGVPICVSLPDANGGPGELVWMYCTQKELAACGEQNYEDAEPTHLSTLQQRRLAWVLGRADESTQDTRGTAQVLVWCVTEDAPANEFYGSAVAYMTYLGVKVDGMCPDWPTIDPTLPKLPELSWQQGVGDKSRCQVMVYASLEKPSIPPSKVPTTAADVDQVTHDDRPRLATTGGPGIPFTALFLLATGTAALLLARRRRESKR